MVRVLRLASPMLRPTVVICCYGAVDAFHGEAGHADFTASYERMLKGDVKYRFVIDNATLAG